MTSVSQLRRDYCDACGETTTHGPSGCIHCVKDGRPARTAATASEVARRIVAGLARRERQVLFALVAGSSVDEIAAAMRIAKVSANCYRLAIAEKLGIRLQRRDTSSAPFQEFARRHGLTHDEAAA